MALRSSSTDRYRSSPTTSMLQRSLYLTIANAKMDSLVEDLRRVILEIAPGGAVLIGESFGGALAMSATLAHPELISGLILVNTSPWLDNRIQLNARRWLLKAVPWAAMPHIRRGTESRIHSPHTTRKDLAEFHDRMRHIGAD